MRLSAWTLFPTLALPPTAAAGGDGNSKKTCKSLFSALPNKVILPSSPVYTTHNQYWSARQSELGPACFVAPRTAQDVSTAIQILIRSNTPFTVKAGGHTAFEGGSSTSAGGVTLDLTHLDAITVSADRKTVSVGAGNRWIDVASALDPLGLAVVGGRSATVGVAGLTLGGGISHFSGERGWACDNVRNYEVVLASGKIVNASPRENRDLYWALRGGGGSNFGVVTRFDLVSFEQGDLWASTRVWPGAANQALIAVLHDLLVKGLATDPAAHTYFVMAPAPELGGNVVLADMFHSTHSDLASPPAVFSPFHDVALPTLVSNTRMSNVSRLLRDIETAPGERQTRWVTSVAATETPGILLEVVKLYEVYLARVQTAAAADNSTIAPILSYQPVSSNILQAMQVNGGNALGLASDGGPIMIVQVSVSWTSAALDDLVERTSEGLVRKIDALAASRRTRNSGFVYMNYAGKTQDVFASYGKRSHARLKRATRKYDPKGKLRKLWRGYFEL